MLCHKRPLVIPLVSLYDTMNLEFDHLGLKQKIILLCIWHHKLLSTVMYKQNVWKHSPLTCLLRYLYMFIHTYDTDTQTQTCAQVHQHSTRSQYVYTHTYVYATLIVTIIK